AGAVIEEGALEVAVIVNAGDLCLKLFFQTRAERCRQHERDERQTAAECDKHADEDHEAAGRTTKNLAAACCLARWQCGLSGHRRGGLTVAGLARLRVLALCLGGARAGCIVLSLRHGRRRVDVRLVLKRCLLARRHRRDTRGRWLLLWRLMRAA